MSSRRVPLTSNPNVANSPLRGASALASFSKQKRSYANLQREEPYGQPPPTKKQALDNGTTRAPRSPSKLPRSQLLIQRGVPATSTARTTTRERSTKASTTSRGVPDDKEVWKKHYRAKFPKMVFYFESIPDDIRAKLTKRVTYLGARQEPFFSIDVTHVITTRSIPTDVPEDQSPEEPEQPEPEPEEQPQTINPSLLDRNPVARRKLLFEFRNVPTRSQQLNDASKPVKGTRNNDVLHKALGMGKKIWSLDKFQTMVSVLLETEAQQATFSKGTGSRAHAGAMKGAHESNLLQLLHHERINGPSDRDPTASLRELNYFKGPYIYVWDMDEKQKPIMVREYAKVANKADGEWPQFRSVGNGRCPFVEEVEIPEKEYRKARAPAPATAKREDPVPILKPPEVPVPKPLTGKRSLAEMEDGQSRVRSATPTEFLNPAKAALSKLKDTRPQNAFTSRAEGGRLFHGEPVASGLQATNVTSAIRSQMISSTAGVTGVRAGTSKEIHGLQRKVLQKAGPTSQEASSRRFAEMTMDPTSSRSINVPRQNSKAPGQEDDGSKADGREKRSQSQSLKSKKDLKPGYCENCQDKFRDFDEHIVSRKHRKFAENDDNWGELDSLLRELRRTPKGLDPEDEEHDY